jgi:hypothetical protein
MPKEVYLVPDVNAWVSQRGGVMGIGSRRIMGVGLPLLQVLTVRELRAVMAHEFGHFHGGDTALGPWIYTTRAAIGRTLGQLTEKSRLLTFPFRIYGNLFLRVTHAISRQQEYAADALAVRTEGAPAMASSLVKTHLAGMLFPAYWRGEVAAVLHAGFRPPIAAGFAEFLATIQQDNVVDEEALKKAAEAEDPYDTHPPLARRLEALKKTSTGGGGEQQAQDARPAIQLVGDADALESTLLACLDRRAPDQRPKLAPIRWEEVGSQVYLPMLTDSVKDSASLIQDATFRALNQRLLESWAPRLAANEANEGGAGNDAVRVAESAVLLALIARGWDLRVNIAKPLALTRGGSAIEPRAKIRELAAGRLSEREWIAWCAELEIADVELIPSEFRSPTQRHAA